MLNNYIYFLNAALLITVPIFLMMALGAWLRHIKLISQDFIQTASNIVFKVGLPVMLFNSTSNHDFSQLINYHHLLFILLTTIITFFVSSVIAGSVIQSAHDKGVFVQGAFRGNLVIIGLAFCASAYPENGIAIATLPTAIIIIVYNFLSIYTLNSTINQQNFSITNICLDTIKNPLILAILFGLFINVINIKLPTVIETTNTYLAKMTLPLALITIGGSLNFSNIKENMRPAVIASLLKIIFCPALLIALHYIYPIDSISIGVLFFLMASPTATASFIMVKAMGGNSDLASKIIIISSLLSIISITLGYALLQSIPIIG